MNYIAHNFELVKEELTRERLLKLQAKALLDTLQSSFSLIGLLYINDKG